MGHALTKEEFEVCQVFKQCYDKGRVAVLRESEKADALKPVEQAGPNNVVSESLSGMLMKHSNVKSNDEDNSPMIGNSSHKL